MWDLKSDAAAEVCGVFRPIATNVRGISIGDQPNADTRLLLMAFDEREPDELGICV